MPAAMACAKMPGVESEEPGVFPGDHIVPAAGGLHGYRGGKTATAGPRASRGDRGATVCHHELFRTTPLPAPARGDPPATI